MEISASILKDYRRPRLSIFGATLQPVPALSDKLLFQLNMAVRGRGFVNITGTQGMHKGMTNVKVK